MLSILAAPKREKSPNICHILQAFQERHQVQKIIVCRIINPTLYRYCIVWQQLVRDGLIVNVYLPW
jgi:hypothetical protein